MSQGNNFIVLAIILLGLFFAFAALLWGLITHSKRQNLYRQQQAKVDEQLQRQEVILSSEEKRQQRQEALLARGEDLARRLDEYLRTLESRRWPDARRSLRYKH